MADPIDILLERAERSEATEAELDQIRAALDAFAPIEGLADGPGPIDVAAAVMAALDVAVDPVGDAVRAEAGSVDVADAVMAMLDVAIDPVGQAVRAEAGSVDVADAVMAAIASPAGMPVVTVAPELPPAANRSRRWVFAALVAAMVTVFVGTAGLVGGGVLVGSQVVGVDGVGIASGGHGGTLPAVAGLAFARASDIVVEDLSFGSDVVVFQEEGDAGALILWVDEEVL